MASAKQMAANQKNSKKSTGPRTVEGKARSRINALRHGLASMQTNFQSLPGGGLLDFERAMARLREVEARQLEIVRSIDRLLINGSPQDVRLALKRLQAVDRYVKAAHAKLK